MSPEQVAGEKKDIDHRSDVYAIGGITFELLANQRPFDCPRDVLFDLLRAIREDVPKKLGAVNRAYRGDLETIVAKSLEKDRSRRYQSAADLAADLSRFLRCEPIHARPISVLARLWR